MLPDFAAVDDGRPDLDTVGRYDAQFHEPIGKQQPVAGPHAMRKPGERGRNAAGPSEKIASGDRQRVAALQLERTSALERASPNLRTTEILQHSHLTPSPHGGRTNPVKRRSVRFVGAVRKIEPKDVGAGSNQRVEHFG